MPVFDEVAGRFDTRKYPAQVYKEVLDAFKDPTRVSGEAIRKALLWKYGHLPKTGSIPLAHQRLIADVRQVWPRASGMVLTTPDQAFIDIDDLCGGRTRFITVAFLTHLLFPEQVPIIDQHNFRAINGFIHDMQPMWLGRKKPSTWSDVKAVGAFMEGVLSAWMSCSVASVPTRERLDQFLMMYGKELKARHNNRLQPTAAGAIMSRRG